jgi:predicted Zn-dependent peptidase
MTEKRFKVEKNIFDGYCIADSTIDGYYAYDKQDLERLCDSLNELVTKCYDLEEENDVLKQQLKTKCIVNKQYEENQRLIKMLDNVANYMQKQYKDMPIDDFVEWWNNIATEGLDD